jgi:CRISPR-associated protein Cpf1
MLPKVCFSNKNLDLFKPSIEISKIYENWTFKTGENFNKEDFIKIVNYYKKCLKKYPDWQVFEFHFSETKKYENLADFYKEVEKDSYNVHFRNKIWSSYINEKVKNWELYLFEIYNKDFAEGKAGKENLHTIYFKWLFEENNLKKPVLKLNWEAEIFFREKSLDEKIDKERKTKREIIENRRYTKDKILFHCPIKLNFAEHNENVNLEINNYIAENSDKIKILWIDRGEKHLAYYSLIEIDSFWNWKIKESWSLNEINNWKKDVNYYNLLDWKEQEKKEGKNKWKYDTNIKELKEWYISQIIHKITKLAIENNAIIIFEDLNMWFKRWRQKIEKQIYQKLEKALIEKLSYLVFKNKNFWEKWNYLSAIQLTSPFTTFKDMWKQTGIIFYTEASYTSTTCPKCGWRKNIYIKYKNKVSAEKDLKKFDKIYFENDNFIFEYKTSNFWKWSDEIVKLFSNRERLKNFRSEKANNQFITESVDIVNWLKGILEKVWINYKTWGNLVDEIILKWMEKIDSDKNLFQSLYYYSNLVLQIRNSKTGDNSRNWDFILCPHCDFDSRKENEIWVKNWDDNGAYNIARKWILIIDKIKKWKKDWNKKYPDLYVKLEEFEELVKN